MTTDTAALVVSASAAVLTILGTLLVVAFKTGKLNGTVTAFMAQAEVWRAGHAQDVGRIEERLNRHIENHTVRE